MSIFVIVLSGLKPHVSDFTFINKLSNQYYYAVHGLIIRIVVYYYLEWSVFYST